MKTTVVIVSFVCLVGIIQLCYGLMCHSCHSHGFSDPDCRVIRDERFLKKCENGAKRCAEVFYLVKKGISQVFRVCMSESMLDSMEANYTDMKRRGIRVGLYLCDYDGCNRRYNLRSKNETFYT